jgi:hypothetical protein
VGAAKAEAFAFREYQFLGRAEGRKMTTVL